MGMGRRPQKFSKGSNVLLCEKLDVFLVELSEHRMRRHMRDRCVVFTEDPEDCFLTLV